jgi:UDP-glucose 4-epimerase
MVLITGGTGYLGGRIVDYLNQSGVQVRVANREIFVNQHSLEQACNNVTAIVHLAAMNAQDCEKDPESALLVNGLGTLRLLKAAEKEGVPKILYFSTAHVYGSPLQGKINEENLPRPTHSYSITHRVAEDYLLEADRREKLSGVVFRLTNAVGSPISWNANCWMLVVNDLCRQVVTHQRMELHSDASLERDFIPISGVCSAVSFALEQNSLDGEIVNISSGRARSLFELTELIADRSVKILGFRPITNFNKSSMSSEGERLEVSNSKLKKTGFTMDTYLSNEIDQLLHNCQKWFGEVKV